MFLDLTRDKCPITFVKTKVALERLKKSCSLIVRINKGNDLDSMQKSLEEIGFKIIQCFILWMYNSGSFLLPMLKFIQISQYEHGNFWHLSLTILKK